MNIDHFKRLKKLRDKGALTQVEFDKEVASYLNSTNVSTEVNDKIISDKMDLIYLGLTIISIYIVVEAIFSAYLETNWKCDKELSQKQCNCLNQVIIRKINFLDKLKILVNGTSST